MGTFNGNEGDFITLSEGGDLTKAYRDANINSTKGVFLGKDKLDQILAQEGCQGLRIYFGLNESDQMTVVVVGADANEDDMTSLVLDKGMLCPSKCGSANVLNGNSLMS